MEAEAPDKEELSRLKAERVTKEIARLRRLLKSIPKGTLDAASSLVRNAAFMTVTLEDLAETINENGVISEYQNGENQWGTKKSPEVEVYNAMIKNHMTIMKQFVDLLPTGAPKTETDELMSFVKKR